LNSIIFLPGFLGVKEDWQEVQNYFPDYQTSALDLPYTNVLETLSREIDRVCVKPPILIGYSMGGRIALQLQKKVEKVIVCSAHPGIFSKQERKEVLLRDEKWAYLLETLPFEKFLEKWYSNPLFAPLKACSPQFEKMLCRRRRQDPKACASLLRSWSAGHFLPVDLSSSTSFLYGEFDDKYAKLYQNLPSHVSVKMIKECGHAAHIEDPAACAQSIREMLGLGTDLSQTQHQL
jgi:2-succinyl-6-hydroxy-2,4-cyclohexadiene-1-carboxylate synthase